MQMPNPPTGGYRTLSFPRAAPGGELEAYLKGAKATAD